VRDWTAERAFTSGALDVHVDPLPIAGAGGKGVDAILIECDPFRHAELASGELRGGCHGILGGGHRGTYARPRRSLRRILPTLDFGKASRNWPSSGPC